MKIFYGSKRYCTYQKTKKLIYNNAIIHLTSPLQSTPTKKFDEASNFCCRCWHLCFSLLFLYTRWAKSFKYTLDNQISYWTGLQSDVHQLWADVRTRLCFVYQFKKHHVMGFEWNPQTPLKKRYKCYFCEMGYFF